MVKLTVWTILGRHSVDVHIQFSPYVNLGLWYLKLSICWFNSVCTLCMYVCLYVSPLVLLHLVTNFRNNIAEYDSILLYYLYPFSNFKVRVNSQYKSRLYKNFDNILKLLKEIKASLICYKKSFWVTTLVFLVRVLYLLRSYISHVS